MFVVQFHPWLPHYISAMWLSSSGYCTVIMFVFSEEVRVLQAEVHKKLSNVHVTIWMSLGRRSPPPPSLRCWQAPFCSVWSDFWTLVSEIDAGSLSKWWCSTVLVSLSSFSETLSTLLVLNSYHNWCAKHTTQKPWKVKRDLSKASAIPRLKTFFKWAYTICYYNLIEKNKNCDYCTIY